MCIRDSSYPVDKRHKSHYSMLAQWIVKKQYYSQMFTYSNYVVRIKTTTSFSSEICINQAVGQRCKLTLFIIYIDDFVRRYKQQILIRTYTLTQHFADYQLIIVATEDKPNRRHTAFISSGRCISENLCSERQSGP